MTQELIEIHSSKFYMPYDMTLSNYESLDSKMRELAHAIGVGMGGGWSRMGGYRGIRTRRCLL